MHRSFAGKQDREPLTVDRERDSRKARKRDTLSRDFPQNLYCYGVTQLPLPLYPAKIAVTAPCTASKVQLPGPTRERYSIYNHCGGKIHKVLRVAHALSTKPSHREEWIDIPQAMRKGTRAGR